jgi:polyhydroxybutyrate depolymerase
LDSAKAAHISILTGEDCVTLLFRPTKAIAAVLALLSSTFPALANCLDQTGPCKIDLGEYDIMRPEGAEGKVPVVMFLHGYGSNGAEVFRNTGMVNAIMARGYALIAPWGRDELGNDGTDWSFHPAYHETRDETVFLRAVLDDAAAKYGVDRDHVLMAGFSIGGSMTAYAACEDPTLAKAYAPISGNFWRPYPSNCAGPIKMLHTHGWTDTTIPLEGRFLGPSDGAASKVAQGDIFHSMELWRAVNGCTEMAADAFAIDGNFWHRRWKRCAPDTALEMVMWPGSHAVPTGWADMVLDWFERL